MYLGICGEDALAIDDIFAAVHFRNITARLADDEAACRFIPRRQSRLPVRIETPGRDIAHIESRAAHAADAAALGQCKTAAKKLIAHGQQAIRKGRPSRHAQALGAGESAGAFFGMKHFIQDRVINNARHDLLVPFETDRNRPVGDAVQEIGGAVEGVDDPAEAFVLAFKLAAFLQQEAVGRTRFLELFLEDFLGFMIRLGDEIAGALAGYLQLLDLAEIADQGAPGLLGRVDHDVDVCGTAGAHFI